MLLQLAGCEDGGCPGIWMDGDQVLTQGRAVTDPEILARTNPAAGETLVTLPKQLLGQALASVMMRALA
ncbi:hypothetical protein [Streptomyces sp.]|uniref:hypothetical protein n=1 Tax=Streptomyces sp. TaxID=1931 RepID=UPI002F42690D